MKKSLKILTTVLGCTLLLAGCNEPAENENNQQQEQQNNTNNNQTNNDEGKTPSIFDVDVGDDITNIKDITIDDDKDIPPEFVKKTCQQISNGSSGGSLIELMTGTYIEPTYTYNCSFSHDKTFTREYTVKSDDRTVAQVSHEEGTSSFTIKGITPGDAIIQAYTDENELVLQFVVHVRERIPMNKIAQRLYNVDVFYGMFYGYKISFTEKNPLKGTLVGNDDFESTKAVFTLGDGVEEKIPNGTDFNTYKFKIKLDTDNSVTTRSYTDMYVSTTGDLIYMYYSNGIVDIFADHFVNIRA
ncbi:MAG: hypothetical protein K6E21_02790 [Bacilli bacterium]|nr:hypothetical protein [Bacilli bacterium]